MKFKVRFYFPTYDQNVPVYLAQKSQHDAILEFPDDNDAFIFVNKMAHELSPDMVVVDVISDERRN